VDGEAGKTWILTGSLDNFRATRKRGFRVIGMKERRRRLRAVSAGDAALVEEAIQGASQLEPAT
jgi:hypothetical protein